MEESSRLEGELVDLVSSLNQRLTTLEAKVTKLSSSDEQGKSRLHEIQEFAENIVTLQERKLAEIDANMKEQRSLVSEMRSQFQSLHNSRINHKDVLVRHENQTKKLVELVNNISEKQNEQEMERTRIRDMKAQRFSTFEVTGRRTHGDELYNLDDLRSSRGPSGGGRHHRRPHFHHSDRQSRTPSNERSRRKSTLDF